jgi:hypothetical protein
MAKKSKLSELFLSLQNDREKYLCSKIRKTFEQKATFNKKAILDFFSNADRIELEKNVIKFVNNLH